MTMTVRISDTVVHDAQIFGKVYNRSVPKQIEFWSRIGKVAEENPEMFYNEIRSILFSFEEKRLGGIEESKFSS